MNRQLAIASFKTKHLSFSSCSTYKQQTKNHDSFTIVTFKDHISKFRLNCQRCHNLKSSLPQLCTDFRKFLFLCCSKEAFVGIGLNQRTKELNLRWVPLLFHTKLPRWSPGNTKQHCLYVYQGIKKWKWDVYNQVVPGSTYLLYKSTTDDVWCTSYLAVLGHL